jgi:hypothetical protein
MKKKKSSFRDKIVKDTVRQKSAGSSYGYLMLPKGVPLLKIEGFKSINLDFLPYEVTDAKHSDRSIDSEIAVEGSLWYKRPYIVHRNIGINNDTIVCPTSIKQRCPICEFKVKRTKEGAEKEELDTLKASQRNLYVVVPRGMKGEEEVPHIWDVSQYLFQNLLNDELEENPDYAVFPDTEEGLTLKIRFEEKQLAKNKFLEASRIDFNERKEVIDEDILSTVPNLDKVLIILSYKELEAKFMEIEDEDEDDVNVPVLVKKQPEPESEEEEEPEEEEEEPSKKSKKVETPVTRKRKPEPEPEEEEESNPKKKQSKEKDIPPKNGKNKCPYGHNFGVDCEEYKECDRCSLWDKCIEEKEG